MPTCFCARWRAGIKLDFRPFTTVLRPGNIASQAGSNEESLNTMSRFHVRRPSIPIALLALALFVVPTPASAEVTISEAAKALPDSIDSFRAEGPAAAPTDGGSLQISGTGEFGRVSTALRSYQNGTGSGITIEVVRTENDSAAYALLTRLVSHDEIRPGVLGLAGVISANRIVFCKGGNLVEVIWTRTAGAQDQLLSFSQAFAATLASGDDEIPVLLMHLPNWQTKVGRAAYAVTLLGLKSVVLNQPVLDCLNFEGGAEAVVANYGPSQLVVVEFTTPQFSVDNDQRIWTRIAELKNAGQAVPSAYRRVGNYSVFVFNAPDEKTANELIDQVKYEKVVQWLGEDPHLYEKLQRYLTQTSAGVLAAVLKSSGLSLLVCFGAGTLIGALLFRRRRAQQATLYSDAGGAVRLNLDEMTGASNSHRLLGPGEQPGSDSNQF